MTNSLPNKLKVTFKRLLGQIVYSYVYTCRKLKNIKSLYFSKSNAKKRKKVFKILTRKHWRLGLTALCLIVGLYYGIGAAISSKIHCKLQEEYAISKDSKQTSLYALVHVIKTQVDDQAWTPALPMIFPASILDNLPNFQIGSKETASYLIKKMAKHYHNENLKKAGKLLDYNPTIWLFSQSENNKLSPGSAKQYRNAMAYLKTAAKEDFKQSPTATDLIYILKITNTLLNRKIDQLDKHIHEHSSELLDFEADDVFYNALGSVYTLHYFLTAVTKDYQKQIVITEQYENITSALHYLENAANLRPLSVKNAVAADAYSANHLYYLAYYLSRAQYYIQEMYYMISAAVPAEEVHEN